MDAPMPFYVVAGHILVVVGSLTLAFTSLRWPRSLIDDLTITYGGIPTKEAVGRSAMRAGIATFGFGSLALGLLLVVAIEIRSAPPSMPAILEGTFLAAIVGALFGGLGWWNHDRAIQEARDRRDDEGGVRPG